MNVTSAEKTLNAAQLDSWHGLLAAYRMAGTQRDVARATIRLEGYLLGLQDAKVINDQEREALYQDAKALEIEAAHRTA